MMSEAKTVGETLLPQQLEQLWAEHLKGEFESKDVEATLATMVEDAYVNHMPVNTGGRGKDSFGVAGELSRGGVGGYNVTRVHLSGSPVAFPPSSACDESKCFPVFSSIFTGCYIAYFVLFPACSVQCFAYSHAWACICPIM